MHFSFEEIVEYISRDETLFPGDVIGSGTVPGCCGLELDRWIQPGDVVELEADGIGVLRNWVVRYRTVTEKSQFARVAGRKRTSPASPQPLVDWNSGRGQLRST